MTVSESGLYFEIRSLDGYFNATAMCRLGGKQFKAWRRSPQTVELLEELSKSLGIPVNFTEVQNPHHGKNCLVHTIAGGRPELQGTWVHPQVAISLAMWISAKFHVACLQALDDLMSGKIPGTHLHNRATEAANQFKQLCTRPTPRDYSKQFPTLIFKLIMELYGHEFLGMNRLPGFVGGFLAKYIYDGLIDDLTRMLKDRRLDHKLREEIALLSEGKQIRKSLRKLHQFLTDEARELVGKRIYDVILMLELSGSPEQFKQNFASRYATQLTLDFNASRPKTKKLSA